MQRNRHCILRGGKSENRSAAGIRAHDLAGIVDPDGHRLGRTRSADGRVAPSLQQKPGCRATAGILAHDLTDIVDTVCFGRDRSGKCDGVVVTGAQRKTESSSGAGIPPYDLPAVVNARGRRGGRARRCDFRISPAAQQEPVLNSALLKRTDDLARVVDPGCVRRSAIRAGNGDGCENSPAQQKAHTVGEILTDDLSAIVDSFRINVESGVDPSARKKPVYYAALLAFSDPTICPLLLTPYATTRWLSR